MSQLEQVVEKFSRDFGATYDYKVNATVPGYNFLHDMARALIGSNISSEANILVPGPGIGKELVNLGGMFKNWQFTAVDPSADMLDMTNNVIAEHGLKERVSLIHGTVDDVPEDTQYDAAVSILVMHFLPDDGGKERFLNTIAARLKPRAPLVLADMYGERGSDAVEQLYRCWKTYLTQIEYDHSTIDNELEMLHFVPEQRITTLLAQAGFDEITKFYQAFLFGGWFSRNG